VIFYLTSKLYFLLYFCDIKYTDREGWRRHLRAKLELQSREGCHVLMAHGVHKGTRKAQTSTKVNRIRNSDPNTNPDDFQSLMGELFV